MELLYRGEHIDESAAVFRILVCCFVPISSTYIFRNPPLPRMAACAS